MVQVVNNGVEDVPIDLAMADLCAFGQAGCATGENEAGYVFAGEGGASYGHFGTAQCKSFLPQRQHILKQQTPLNPIPFNVDYRQRITEYGFNFGYVGGEIAGVEEDFGGCVFEQSGRFSPMQPPVERRMNRTQLPARKKAI